MKNRHVRGTPVQIAVELQRQAKAQLHAGAQTPTAVYARALLLLGAVHKIQIRDVELVIVELLERYRKELTNSLPN